MDHKKLRLLSLFLVSVSLGALGGCVARRARAAVATYSQDLKPGMTRKEVEDYFRANKISFRHRCCGGGSNEHSLDDFIEIGTQHIPVPCGDSTSYVVFIYDAQTWHPPAGLPQADDRDTLRSITTISEVDDCF
jgi:hypothetical protein